MGRNHYGVFAVIFLAIAALAAPLASSNIQAAEDDGVEWTQLTALRFAPGDIGSTYILTKEFKTEELALRFKSDHAPIEGRRGTLVITLYKIGRPPRKWVVIKENNRGEKEVAMRVEPGEYKVEISMNNIKGTLTVEEGKKK